MTMSQRLIFLLGLSCILAFSGAVWAFVSGFGLIVSFLIYAFGGATLLLGFSALAMVKFPDNEDTESSVFVMN